MFWHVISGGGNQTFSKRYTKTEIHSPKSSISRKWILSRTTQLFVYFTRNENKNISAKCDSCNIGNWTQMHFRRKKFGSVL